MRTAHPAAAPLLAGALLLAGAGCSGSLGSVPGTYTVNGVLCNGVAPTAGGIAAWISPPSELIFHLNSSGTSTQVFTNGTCTITLSFTTASDASGSLSFTGTGTYACAGDCASYATTIFGSNACGTNNTQKPSFTMSPALGVASQEQLTLSAPGTDTTCSSYGDTDPLTYTLVKQ